MTFKEKLFPLWFLFFYFSVTSTVNSSVSHSHYGKVHSHVLPASGMNHTQDEGLTTISDTYSIYGSGGSTVDPISSDRNTYTVQRGDSVFQIMRNTGVYWKDIIKLNDLQPPDYMITSGQVLRLRKARTSVASSEKTTYYDYSSNKRLPADTDSLKVTLHAHDGRDHEHPLPISGTNHTHNILHRHADKEHNHLLPTKGLNHSHNEKDNTDRLSPKNSNEKLNINPPSKSIDNELAKPVSHPLNKQSPLGINTNEAMDINSSIPFVNLFKLSLPFENARPWLTKGNITYDKDGWPKTLNGGQAGTRFISNLPANTIPSGLYTVLYTGKGKLKYGVDAKLVSSTPGKDIIRIQPGKNGRISAAITITESTPKNHLRDIRILMPGGICMGDAFKRVDEQNQCGSRKFLSFEQYHEQILFNPDYLNFMKDFKVIRFMNMSGITRNDLSKWKDRSTMSQATWGGKEGVRGVPLEVMVELANQVNADPWFNIPHKADNQFVRNYAQYVKKNLKPNLKAYIEYTNEAWNGIFSQAHYMKDMGQKLKLDKNRDQAGYKFFSKRSVEIFNIWEHVFDEANNIVRVMGSFTTHKRLSETLLKYKDAYKHTDAIAIAPYFYIDQKEVMSIRSIDTVFKRLTAKDNRYSIPNILKSVKDQAEVAEKYNVSLVAYEGGQHLVAYKTHTVREGPNPYLIFANKDKRMAQLYYQFLKGWKDAGGELFVAFSAPRLYTWIGSWGIKEYITQPAEETPKYQALMAFNKNEPCWWDSCKTSSTGFSNASQIVRVRMEASTIQKVRAKPTTIRPLQDALSEKISSLDAKRNVQEHKIHYVQDSNRIFKRISNFRLMNRIAGDIDGSSDLAANWQAHWDQHALHIKVDVTDDRFIKDSIVPWSDDSIEIFIDADASRLSAYDKKNDFQLMYRWNDDEVIAGQNSPEGKLSKIIKKIQKDDTGYALETSIPWKTLGIHPSEGHTLGIDIQINDDDDGDVLDGKLAWNAKADTSWNNPQSFGQMVLVLDNPTNKTGIDYDEKVTTYRNYGDLSGANTTYYDYSDSTTTANTSYYYDYSKVGTVSQKGQVTHSHNGKTHSHVLPASGMNHTHNTGSTSISDTYNTYASGDTETQPLKSEPFVNPFAPLPTSKYDTSEEQVVITIPSSKDHSDPYDLGLQQPPIISGLRTFRIKIIEHSNNYLYSISAASFITILLSMYLWTRYRNPLLRQLSNELNALLHVLPEQLYEAHQRLSKTGRLEKVLTDTAVSEHTLKKAISFVSNNKTSSGQGDATQAKNQAKWLAQRLGYKLDEMDRLLFRLRVNTQFPLNVDQCLLFFPPCNIAAIDALNHLRSTPNPRHSIVLVIGNNSDYQRELRRKTMDVGNKWVAPDGASLTELLLSPEPEVVLARIIAEQIPLTQISPYQLGGGTSREAMFFGRGEIIAHIMNRDPANYLLVAGRQLGKSTLLKALERRYQDNEHIRCFYRALADEKLEPQLARALRLPGKSSLNEIIEHLEKEIEKDKRHYLFLIDEADTFIRHERNSGYKILNTLRQLSEAGNCSFILTGFWHLYNYSVLDYQSPLKNFGEVLQLGALEADACQQLATVPMQNMGISYAADALVDELIEQTGQRANLISISCNEILKQLGKEQRVIEAGDIHRALQSDPITRAMEGWKNLSGIAEDDRIDRVIVYTMIPEEQFSLSELDAAVKEKGFNVPVGNLERSLARLELAFILQRNGKHYSWRVPLFCSRLREQELEIRLMGEFETP